MDLLKLALKSRIPLIHITTDDTINVIEVLEHLANAPLPKESYTVKVASSEVPEVIKKASEVVFSDADIIVTSAEVKTLAKLYRAAVDKEKTIVFVNTTKAPLMLDGGVPVPPKELVLEYLTDMQVDDPQSILPAVGGLSLKDMGEVIKMTAFRDDSVTVRGINETRRGYRKLQGITQVDTDQSYYVKPKDLAEYLSFNLQFFQSEYLKLRPRGLLFNGPPGTGKTEAAKAIASAFNVPLYRLDLGTMMGKYVGDSEGNLNAALAQVDEVEPCVVIFDEVEKVFRNLGGDSGVTSRMLSQLLWWLQEHKTKVFTVMTTNDMNAIPPELFREGRIDRQMTFTGIADFNTGYAFAKGALSVLMKELGEKDPDVGVFEELSKRVKMTYADGQPVPQAKLVQVVNTLAKEVVSGLVASKTAAGTDEDKPKAAVLKLKK